MRISKTKHNKQKEQQELSDEEEYRTDQQYEQERFTVKRWKCIRQKIGI
jgi:hypothetical protein